MQLGLRPYAAYAANSCRRATLVALLRRASGVEVKWLVRILQRDVRIGARPAQPVAHKGEWPKIVMDGLCRAQARRCGASNRASSA